MITLTIMTMENTITGTDSVSVVRTSGVELRPADDESVRIFPGDLRIDAGQRWALMGPSGCGKTTLLNTLCGLLAPAAGVLRVLERDVYAMKAAERDRFRGRRLGVVHQNFHLLSGFSALENLTVALRFSADVKGPSARKQAEVMLEAAGLGDRAHTRVERLSRGEAQRVAVARALVHRPELLLTDEPTASLDAERGTAMLDWIETLRAETGCAWLCVTHDAAVAARFEHTMDARAWKSSGEAA